MEHGNVSGDYEAYWILDDQNIQNESGKKIRKLEKIMIVIYDYLVKALENPAGPSDDEFSFSIILRTYLLRKIKSVTK